MISCYSYHIDLAYSARSAWFCDICGSDDECIYVCVGHGSPLAASSAADVQKHCYPGVFFQWNFSEKMKSKLKISFILKYTWNSRILRHVLVTLMYVRYLYVSMYYVSIYVCK